MELTINQKLLPVKHRTHGGKLKKVKNIVIHWTGNAGQGGKGVWKWFYLIGQGKAYLANGLKAEYGSSHYHIDIDGTISQLVSTDTVAYTNGGKKYTDLARYKYRKNGKGKPRPNNHCVSIECSHPDWSGKFTEETEAALLRLCQYLRNQFGLNDEDVIRHHDITYKKCPKYYVTNPDAWVKFKTNLRFAVRS